MSLWLAHDAENRSVLMRYALSICSVASDNLYLLISISPNACIA